MTLSEFLQTYVYFPLGGSRKGRLRACVNTMLTFLVSGLWHGANWTFIFWGFLHGLGVIASGREKTGRLRRMLCRAGTLACVCMAFVFFRADSLGDGFALLGRILTGGRNGSLIAVAAAMEPPELYIVTKALSMAAPGLVGAVQIGALALLGLICLLLLTGRRTQELAEREQISPGFPFLLAFLFAWSVISLSGVGTFVYFNF